MLTEAERKLLVYYSTGERIIDGTQRTMQHQRLLALGYIHERGLDTREALITVTPSGRIALGR